MTATVLANILADGILSEKLFPVSVPNLLFHFYHMRVSDSENIDNEMTTMFPTQARFKGIKVQ